MQVNKGNGHSSVNLELHELAHSIDIYVFNELRYNQDFLEIWNQEKDQLFPGKSYYLTYPEEYFAESFAYYYFGGQYRNELKKESTSNIPIDKQIIIIIIYLLLCRFLLKWVLNSTFSRC